MSKKRVVSEQAPEAEAPSVDEAAEDIYEINDYISAAEIGNLQFVKQWVATGRDPDQAKQENGVTALMAAVIHDQKSVVQYLLSSTVRSNVIICDNNGWTPLHFATLNCGRRDGNALYYVDLLLQSAADVHARISAADPRKEFRSMTPLHLASRAKNFEVCKKLFDAGARFDARDYKGRVPFDDSICGIEFRARLIQELNLPALVHPVVVPNDIASGGGPADIELASILRQEPDGPKQKSKFFRSHLFSAFNKINEQKLVIDAYQRAERKADAKSNRQGKAEVAHYRKLVDAKDARISELMEEVKRAREVEETLRARLELASQELSRFTDRNQQLTQQVIRMTPKGKNAFSPRESGSAAEVLSNIKKSGLEGRSKKRQRDPEVDVAADDEFDEVLPTEGYEVVSPPAKKRRLFSSNNGTVAPPRESEPAPDKYTSNHVNRQKRTVRGDPQLRGAPPSLASRSDVFDGKEEEEEEDLPDLIDGDEYHRAMEELAAAVEESAPEPSQPKQRSGQKKSLYRQPRKSQTGKL